MFGLLILIDDDIFFEYDKIKEDVGNVFYNKVSAGERKSVTIMTGSKLSTYMGKLMYEHGFQLYIGDYSFIKQQIDRNEVQYAIYYTRDHDDEVTSTQKMQALLYKLTQIHNIPVWTRYVPEKERI